MHHKHFRFEFIRVLMKDFPEPEVIEAEERFARYLDICAEIVERRAKGDTQKFE